MLHINSYIVTIMHAAGCLDINSSLLQIRSNFSQAPGTNLSLTCVHNQAVLTSIVCQDDGLWEPNPHAFTSLCDINDSGESASLYMFSCSIARLL